MTKDDTALDGGANIGAFSFAVPRKVKRIVAVEAIENNFKILIENIKRNNMTNVIPILTALTDSPGEIKFEGNGETGHISGRGTNVKATTIDEIESNIKIEFDALKIDIEGSEPAAIMGGPKML
ncbi:MAG: FkbM family methyltransferase [Candidatus Thermoplasmatota archaeon]|nr:FkbM family methyltransferase [Candidatus Thermoplasmatota archaeon]